MKHYIIYDDKGQEQEIIEASSHNDAEKKAQEKYGQNATVVYTEI